MLYQVFAKGPFMQGIFRKSANARQVRELREKLDTGLEVTWDHVPVLVTAALIKDFLRSLPDPLLTTALYDQWRAAVEAPNLNTKLYRLKGVLGQLPKPNHLLLIHFLCVLYHIARRSCHTLMSAANLGVCVGPSLLWSDFPNVSDDLRIVPAVVECLITHCEYLCGSHVPSLLGDLRDSGTEESDSMKRDDSSIDSLECSPPPRKDQMSLSRDSGLTMSDSQLYTPDEVESGSTSSSGYDPAFESHTKVSPSVSMPVNYVRVYGGWEDRLNNPNHFQRQAWFRQRSRRMNQPPTNKSDVRRTASDESLLDNSTASDLPPAPPRREKTYNRYEAQTSTHSRSTNGAMVARRFAVCSSSKGAGSTDSDVERALNVSCVDCNKGTPSSMFNLRKESSNAKHAVRTNATERRSISLNTLTIKGGSVNSLSSTSHRPKAHHYSNTCLSTSVVGRLNDVSDVSFGPAEPYYAIREQTNEDNNNNNNTKSGECGEDSSTLSDEDCTPHVSRSNSRGNEVVAQLRYPTSTTPTSTSTPATLQQQQQQQQQQHQTTAVAVAQPSHSDTCVVRGRVRRKEERVAHRSRSLPPPPPYRPPPPATSRRAPITSYHLGDCNQQLQNFVITRSYMDEESYV